MSSCKACGKHLGFLQGNKGMCQQCFLDSMSEAITGGSKEDKLAQRIERKAEIETILLTTETAHNLPVVERIEIVIAGVAYGMNLFKDLFAGVRDIVGGRSAAVIAFMALLTTQASGEVCNITNVTTCTSQSLCSEAMKSVIQDNWGWRNKTDTFVQEAEKRGIDCTNFEPRDTNSDNICEYVEKVAKSIMAGRQENLSISEVLKAVKDAPVLQVIVLNSYDTPRYNTPSNQLQAIRDFANSWALKCYKGELDITSQTITLPTSKSEQIDINKFVPERIYREVGVLPMRCYDPKRHIVYSHSPYGMSCSGSDYPISDFDFERFDRLNKQN